MCPCFPLPAILAFPVAIEKGFRGAARCGASASLFACGRPQSVPDLTLQPGPGWGRSSFPLPGVRRPASATPFPSPVIYP